MMIRGLAGVAGDAAWRGAGGGGRGWLQRRLGGGNVGRAVGGGRRRRAGRLVAAAGGGERAGPGSAGPATRPRPVGRARPAATQPTRGRSGRRSPQASRGAGGTRPRGGRSGSAGCARGRCAAGPCGAGASESVISRPQYLSSATARFDHALSSTSVLLATRSCAAIHPRKTRPDGVQPRRMAHMMLTLPPDYRPGEAEEFMEPRQAEYFRQKAAAVAQRPAAGSGRHPGQLVRRRHPRSRYHRSSERRNRSGAGTSNQGPSPQADQQDRPGAAAYRGWHLRLL